MYLQKLNYDTGDFNIILTELSPTFFSKIEIFDRKSDLTLKSQMVVSLRNHDQSTSKRRLGFRDGIYLRDIWKQGNLTIINHKNALFTTLYHYPFHVHLATIVIIKINFDVI